MVEVVSSLERDGRPVFRDLRWGVYVVLKAPNDYAAPASSNTASSPIDSGRYAAMYKPFHLIGLELSISVLNAALRARADRQLHGPGAAMRWRSPSAALKAGETLDGEGGYTVYGKLIPAARSLAEEALPIGLAHGVKLTRDVTAGAMLTRADVASLDSEARARAPRDGARLRRRVSSISPAAR